MEEVPVLQKNNEAHKFKEVSKQKMRQSGGSNKQTIMEPFSERLPQTTKEPFSDRLPQTKKEPLPQTTKEPFSGRLPQKNIGAVQ